jgi:hypothetical protein
MINYILNDLAYAYSQIEANDLIAVDTETYSEEDPSMNLGLALDCFSAKIRLLQLGFLNNYPVILDAQKVDLLPIFKALMRPGLIKVFHNKKFDLKMIKSNYDLWLKDCHCTLLMYKLIGVATGYTAARSRKFNLAAMMRDLMGINLDKTEGKSYWGDILTEEQLNYAALDVGAEDRPGSYLLECYLKLKAAIDQPLGKGGYNLTRSHNIDELTADSLAKVEYEGIPINKDILEAYIEFLKKEKHIKMEKLVKDLNLGYTYGLPYTDSEGNSYVELIIPAKVETLLNSPKELVKLIAQKLGKDLFDLQASTLEEVLKDLQEESQSLENNEDYLIDFNDIEFNIDLIDCLLQYKRAQKIISMGYAKLIHPKTGRIHANYSTIGTATSRLSSGGKASVQSLTMFNAQNVPNHTFNLKSDSLPCDKYPLEKFIIR